MGENLSNKIATILNSAPTSFDPEDDVTDNTAARVEYKQDDLHSDDDLNLSKFRKQNVELLEEVDQRYTGTRVSRKSLEDSDSDYEEIDQAEDDYEESSDEESDEQDMSEGDSDSEGSEGEKGSLDDTSTKVFTNKSTSEMINQSNKSSCVRQQLSIWENLLEIRIQMQKCLHTSNKFPQTSHLGHLQKNSIEFSDRIEETRDHVQSLLDKFFYLQLLLLKRYPETKNILEKDGNKVKNQSDEEIPSDTDEEISNNVVDGLENEIPQKRMKLSEYKDELSGRFESYRNYRNSVLQKWHDKTRIVSSKSENVHSVAQQVKHILSSKDKLIKATQLKRADYSILGENGGNTDESSEVYNSNIFDDTDFYHHLLRELIEFKSADLTDPIKLSRQWVQLQSLRSKMKKKVDTKATKGRKIRYVVHPKLVNFMAPVEDITWQESAKTELYNSLFGKNRPNAIV